MSPHSLPLCRGRGDGICRDELQWLRKHHTPPLYFRQCPNVSSVCYSESGHPCKGHSPHSACRRLQCPLVYLFLHPSSFRGPHSPSATYLRSEFSKEAHGGSLLAPLKAVLHPSLQSGAPFASHGGQVKYDSWVWGCTADQAAGTSTRKTCQKDFISSYDLGKETLSGLCLCWLEM